MPFQSEKQRRYLWANEPEIARDWTNTYGSKIQKANGGRIGFAKGSDPRALKQRFIEVIRLMNEAEGNELAALALEARTLKEQMETLEQIEPFVGQGIQSLQRRGGPQRTSLLSKDLRGPSLTPDDQGYQIFQEGYGKEQIFPGIKTDPIIEQQVQFTKQKPIYRAVKGRMDRKSVERFKEMLERYRPSRAEGGLTSIRQPYFSGGEIIEMGLKQILASQAKKKAQEYGYLPQPTQKKGMGWLGKMLATMFLGPAAGLAWDLGSGYMNKRNPGSSFASNVSIPKIGNFNLRSGYGSQGAYEKARQDRINMKRQSNIIKTLQSGKYAPGWEKTAFDRVQKLGKTLNLVDADDVSLTGRSKSKPRAPVGPPPGGGPHGNGGGHSRGRDTSQADADAAGGASLSSPFNRGGLAGLWPR